MKVPYTPYYKSSRFSIFLLFFTLLSCCITYSQEQENNTYKSFKFLDEASDIGTRLKKEIINVKDGEIITNVLQIYNRTSLSPIKFRLELLTPKGWTPIVNPKDIHRVLIKDTISIPIVYIPSKKLQSINEININVFVIDLDGRQLADNYFTVVSHHKKGWTVNVEKNTEYLKNGDTIAELDYNIQNTGNYDQDIYIQHLIPKKNITVTDTLNKPVANKTVTLKPKEEFHQKLDLEFIKKEQRNKRRISTNSYDPYKKDEKVVHDIIIQSTEPKYTTGKSTSRNSKVSYVKLPNEVIADKYGYTTLPLTIDFSVQNLMGDYSFASLNIRGYKELSQNSQLIYSSQFNYSSSVLNNNVFKNVPWYVGYFDNKKSLELGLISGNLIGLQSSGYGIKAGYQINDSHRVNAFYIRPDSFFNQLNKNETYGAEYNFNYRGLLGAKVGAGRNVNLGLDRATNTANIQPTISLFNRHRISLYAAYTQLTDSSGEIKLNEGYATGLGYSSSFFNKIWRPVISVRTNTKGYGNGNYIRELINHRSTFSINKRVDLLATNSFQTYENYSTVSDDLINYQKINTNTLLVSTHKQRNTLQYGGYYHFYDTQNTPRIERGLIIRQSSSNFLNNFLSSLYLRAGYNKASEMGAKDFFNLELSSYIKYRTFTFSNRYFYGSNSLETSLYGTDIAEKTPQNFRSSLSHQYQFKNKHLILENNLVFNYLNTAKKVGLGLYSYLYYFGKYGIRYGIQSNLSYSSSSILLNSFNTNTGTVDLNQTTKNINDLNLNLNFSIRKDFAIPIPFLKDKKTDLNFVAFMDLNGNGKKDFNEIPINNVVIKVGNDEVITNLEGKASVKQKFKGFYKVDIIPLEKINGWFPNINTSTPMEFKEKLVYVPFSRGVKIVGDVILDRQEIANVNKNRTDLSNIKIVATGKTAEGRDRTSQALTDVNGHFELFVANGNYILTMDESILDSNLKLSRNNIPITLKNTQKSVYTAFYIREIRREVKIKDFTVRN
ncbi:hypothetical protein FHR24_001141 [Wenyingzhuangia heitensis]|uniref:SD-repeat containing protein B domain-containing protein n=1 Tax=Wenyingzhuangia heitensis TaxID=1487859 RepID=A0ABX0UCB9_9FLAO|nr:hypothetical protein [Wenyingzhuangia heitensis]NIJ44702.1 hypothetical protein [Wenyingzhuangia heitensis]